MSETQQIGGASASPGTRQAWQDLLWSAAFALSGLGCALAWLLPRTKTNALFGRLNGWQTSLAVFVSAVFISFALIALSTAKSRQVMGFRLLSVWLGVFLVLVPCELSCLLLPTGHLEDNPFYVFVGRGVVDDEEDQVRFVRPPNLTWRGRSRGDLAMIADVPDPYAQDILYQTDSEGFRNSQDIKRADVVFLGDSFTEAGNVREEETFVRRVAGELDVVARNLGRCAYGPSEELIILKKHGLNYRPRHVVWQFAETNDLNDEVKFQNWISLGRPRDSADSRMPPAEAWRRRSPSYRVFKLLRQAKPWPYAGTFRDAQGTEHVFLFSRPPDVANHSPVGHDGWQVLRDTLRFGVELLRENQIELTVLLIPKKMRVMGPYIELSDLTQTALAHDWDLKPDQTLAIHLQERCDALQVPFIDATPELKRQAAAGNLVYLPLDSHLSAQGHAVVASLLVAALRGKL